VITTKQLEI